MTFRHETDINKIVGRLSDVSSAALDVVAPSTKVTYGLGASMMMLDEPHMDSHGVRETLPLRFTRTALRQQAERFGIPLRYVDLLTEEQPELLANNFNQRSQHLNEATLYRMVRQEKAADEGSAEYPAANQIYWRVRAVLSNRFNAIDHLDVITAVARGAEAANVDLSQCYVEGDWTDDRLRLRISVPQIELAAPDLLRDYRSPFGDADWSTHHRAFQQRIQQEGRHVGDVMWAGLEVANSETGMGAATVAPRAMILACLNGMTRKADIVRAVHLGGRLEQGAVTWSAETRRKELAVIESKMTDAVNQFCSVDYLRELVAQMAEAKGVEVQNVTKAMEVAQTRLGFSEDEVNAALNMFTRSGETSVFGLGQAFTAVAQTVDDGDRQTDIEQTFWDIVNHAEEFQGV